ncbi:YvcK family protein [Patescibacteria group bacterium]|nr:MAG: YvcK family protein [Patescibacteria group bacterium]
MDSKKIVTIGGGTGNFTVLSGLKEYKHQLSAIVSMADDGGSTGVLRTELGVLPPGDVRQCLVALSRSSALLRDLFTYRFESGRFEGANLGNLFLSALQKITGDFDTAVQRTGEVLRIRGSVIPVTTENITLVATLSDGFVVRGQAEINNTVLTAAVSLTLDPMPRANPRALAAIAEADLVVIGPGDLFTSIIPNLLVRGVPAALSSSSARKVYVANLVNKPNHTKDFHVADYALVIEKYLGARAFDAVIYNTEPPSAELLSRYAREGERPVRSDGEGFEGAAYRAIGAPLLSEKIVAPQNPHDQIERTLIRHDSVKLAKVLLEQFLDR